MIAAVNNCTTTDRFWSPCCCYLQFPLQLKVPGTVSHSLHFRCIRVYLEQRSKSVDSSVCLSVPRLHLENRRTEFHWIWFWRILRKN